jgi:hypothetical protein
MSFTLLLRAIVMVNLRAIEREMGIERCIVKYSHSLLDPPNRIFGLANSCGIGLFHKDV